jgi:hypothetical protein
MTLELRVLSDEQIQDFFLKDPNVSFLGLTDDNLQSMYSQGKYLSGSHSCMLGIYEGEDLCAIFKWELFTPETINIHLFVGTKWHKTGQMSKIFYFMKNHLETKTSFKKVIAMVPSVCEHVWKPLEHFNFVREAHLTKCLVWRNELVDMFIYSINLTRENLDGN